MRILQRIADSLEASTDAILEANAADVAAMAGRIDQQLMQRLQLKPAKLQSLINSARRSSAAEVFILDPVISHTCLQPWRPTRVYRCMLWNTAAACSFSSRRCRACRTSSLVCSVLAVLMRSCCEARAAALVRPLILNPILHKRVIDCPCVAGVRAIAAQDEPIRRVLSRMEVADGLTLEKVTCPPAH